MCLTNHFLNAKIGTKFNWFLVVVFAIGISLTGAALSTVLEQRAEHEVTSQAKMLMQTINSVRNYTQERVNPLLLSKLETEAAFIPEAIPTFSAREIFEDLRKTEEYKNFFFKDAAPNPTNLRDKADDFETELVNYFRTHPNIKERSGFRTIPGSRLFYIARPFALKEQKCLQCHSKPEIAPKSLVATYGSENGFGWKLNEIVAVQIVSLSAEEVFASTRHSFVFVIGILIFIFTIVIFLINFLLRKTVLERIKKIAKIAQKVSFGEMNVVFEEKSKDEIGILATALDRMKSSLEISMNYLKKQKK